eukprot:NODE_11191_length_559_cov_29.130734_g10909_i0.p1 GENE.NODE_11191_length_559_cov_29.130734_g10909_i0~~NODE_11191_length_559_cov_29.130734_g10909_i0.p1  ORF type:complete len:100 (-),score=2.67 NODE_11191_length_559_cov_29.130734_g10909_i0:164-463(-)
MIVVAIFFQNCHERFCGSLASTLPFLMLVPIAVLVGEFVPSTSRVCTVGRFIGIFILSNGLTDDSNVLSSVMTTYLILHVSSGIIAENTYMPPSPSQSV